jgi:hypothetical protein
MTSKLCRGCETCKPLLEFNNDRRKNDRLMSRCKTCRNKSNAEWRRRNPNYEITRYWSNPTAHRERHLIRKYGVSLTDYNSMFSDQMGACAICGKTQRRALDVDHCHKTGSVRGLLCTTCNQMIGHSGDSPDRLVKAAEYLRKSPTKLSKKSESCQSSK